MLPGGAPVPHNECAVEAFVVHWPMYPKDVTDCDVVEFRRDCPVWDGKPYTLGAKP